MKKNNLNVNNIFTTLDKQINLAVKKALEKHQKLGGSVLVYENREIKFIQEKKSTFY